MPTIIFSLHLALSESLDSEIKPFGLRSICFEPGYFRTNFLAENNRGQGKARIADYQELVDATNTRFASAFISPAAVLLAQLRY